MYILFPLLLLKNINQYYSLNYTSPCKLYFLPKPWQNVVESGKLVNSCEGSRQSNKLQNLHLIKNTMIKTFQLDSHLTCMIILVLIWQYPKIKEYMYMELKHMKYVSLKIKKKHLVWLFWHTCEILHLFSFSWNLSFPCVSHTHPWANMAADMLNLLIADRAYKKNTGCWIKFQLLVKFCVMNDNSH